LDVQRTGEKGAGGRKFEGAAPDITGDASNIPVQDGSLDYIVACHLFEHLVDPTGALKEFRRALKPGGDLILSLPNHDRQETMMIDYTHVHAYNPGSARNLLETAGWKIKEERDFETIGSFGMVAS
jgi:ubiquinone/menaquinone biosynthesis C-methylase UbiE